MYPIALDLTKIPVLLIGRGELLARRLRQLEEYGAERVKLAEYLSDEDIKNAAVIMVAGLPREEAESIVNTAHAAGKLVNVEDINDLCDFYFTANVKRGDLIIAVSTSGASPTLARKIRDKIAAYFGEEWTSRLSEMAELRNAWRAQGAGMKEVAASAERYLEEKGWLADKDKAA